MCKVRKFLTINIGVHSFISLQISPDPLYGFAQNIVHNLSQISNPSKGYPEFDFLSHNDIMIHLERLLFELNNDIKNFTGIFLLGDRVLFATSFKLAFFSLNHFVGKKRYRKNDYLISWCLMRILWTFEKMKFELILLLGLSCHVVLGLSSSLCSTSEIMEVLKSYAACAEEANALLKDPFISSDNKVY